MSSFKKQIELRFSLSMRKKTMCGITALLNPRGNVHEKKEMIKKWSERLKHRGPDWTGHHFSLDHLMYHERLSINGVESGHQPIVSGNITLCVNGEIYNDKELAKGRSLVSDCEAIIHLYKDVDLESHEDFTTPSKNNISITSNFINRLDGDFAFVITDSDKKIHIAARDPFGVVPMYYGYNRECYGEVIFASEMKALSYFSVIGVVEPGTFFIGNFDKEGEPVFHRYYRPLWDNDKMIVDKNITPLQIHNLLATAVEKRILLTEVPWGVFLSGGLDSSVVAYLAQKLTPNERINTFSIGLEGSPDLEAARKVAKHIHSIHHEFKFTVEEGLEELQTLIYHLESYDVTTIRASLPMYLLSKHVKAMGFKMVLSGEGSDEIFGGYLYFHEAPSDREFRMETKRRVKNLHLSDCLRANKSTMAASLEVRVPFLDREFVDVCMKVDPKECIKDGIEKWILRKAFEGCLPDELLWRQKEQFSDGVGYNWIDTLKAEAEKRVSDSEFASRRTTFIDNIPTTKEGYWYREMFEQQYSHPKYSTTVETWIPEWSSNKDPSGRAQKVHNQKL